MYSIDKIYYYDPETKGLLYDYELGGYLDPFWKDKYVIPKNYGYDNYFWDNYGISAERVYWLLNDIHETPKCQCEGCDNELKFKGLYYGYGKFCSKECLNTSNSRNPINRKKHSEHLSRYNQEINSNKYYQAWSHFKGFLTKYKDRDDELNLYIYWSNDNKLYKFGVTFDINHKRTYGIYPRSIFRGNKLLVLIFEYLLSRYFGSECIGDLKLFKKLYKIIRYKVLINNNYSSTIEQLEELNNKLYEYIQVDGNIGPLIM